MHLARYGVVAFLRNPSADASVQERFLSEIGGRGRGCGGGHWPQRGEPHSQKIAGFPLSRFETGVPGYLVYLSGDETACDDRKITDIIPVATIEPDCRDV